jgi:hypothetical protein
MMRRSFGGRGMKVAAIIIGILLIAPAAIAKHAPKHAAKPQPANTATLRFPEVPSAVVTTKSGAVYRVTLAPRPSVKGALVGLELVVQRQADPLEAANLLDPPGNWAGYQPYTFAATDFKSGPAQSMYGDARTICRAGLKTAFTVQSTSVEKVVLEHHFVAMVVAVTLDDAMVEGEETRCS